MRAALVGFIFGLVFSFLHIYLNLRFDLPLYLILVAFDKTVSCTKQGCLPYVVAAVGISSIIWAILFGIAARFINFRDFDPTKDARP
ncbi:MAG: hypothetical protein HY220_03005 [Candidatus Sungbacteria bacterium]|uniref:Uncharacterized protein n=1 Tax=Candidatus Sungiibacteriota bacterium TaxID=2750080 RepID=A0A9D6QU06_9BACT|nr:hypothetical protein [Candidatus Sungbacteria bacterium]